MEHYVYAYLRVDGTPYYIGKGKGKRAWTKQSHNAPPPRDRARIVIMERGLTDVGALALERFYIRWYGRKSEGGILRNPTEGGEGNTTAKGGDWKGDKNPSRKRDCSGSSNGFAGKTHDENARLKMSAKSKGRPSPRGMLNKKHDPETKRKMSEARARYWAERKALALSSDTPRP